MVSATGRCKTDPVSKGSAGVGRVNSCGDKSRDKWLESRGGAGAGSRNGRDNDNSYGSVGTLRKCKTEPKIRGSVDGGGESTLCDEGTPRARGPQRGDTGDGIGPRRGGTRDAIGPRIGDT